MMPIVPLVAWTLAAVATAPQLKTGGLPALPGEAVGGGEVLLEATVGAGGAVEDVRALRATPPYTELLTAAVKGWRFEPARNADGEAVRAAVLVAGSFRPATLIGPAAGDPPADVAVASPAVPAPSSMAPPLYPVDAQGDEVTLAEVDVAADGAATVRVVRGAPPFREATAQALAQWRFEPARTGGVAVPSRAYVAMGFRQPVGAGPVPRP